ncbi:MAG: DUF4395 domain-containing protein [Mycobacteriales bacterium]
MFSFPNPVNEIAARVVAAGVVLLSLGTLLLGFADDRFLWLTVPLAYGFVARVLNGPRWSPLGLLATRVVAPRIGHAKLVAGPPKRFAQGIGAVVTVVAVVLVALGQFGAAQALLGLMVVFATLESVFALCVGCKIFAGLMRVGLIPEETCEACNNISLRPQAA